MNRFSIIPFLVTAAAVPFSSLEDGRSQYGNTSLAHGHPQHGNVTQRHSKYATDDAIKFFDNYFYQKSVHNGDAFMDTYSYPGADYCDGTLGMCFPNDWFGINATFNGPTGIGAAPANATSYGLQYLGDTNSSLIYFVDSESFFGTEIRALSAIDFLDGKMIRQCDYWSGRGDPFPPAQHTPSNDDYFYDLGLSNVTENADPAIQQFVKNLTTALEAGDAIASASLFDVDAVIEDLALRTRVEGQIDIQNYLQKGLSILPYGPGSTVRHVLGKHNAGGYEWGRGVNSTDTIRAGIVALELNDAGLIQSFRTTYDITRADNATLGSLALLAVA